MPGEHQIVAEIRELLSRVAIDHEGRIRALERRHGIATAVISAVASVVTAAIYAAFT